MKLLLAFALEAAVVINSAQSNDNYQSDAVNFDEQVINPGALYFDHDDDRTEPSLSSFGISDFAFLSNELGERYALVTVENREASSRDFSEMQIMALTAEGAKRFPRQFRARVDGRGKRTILLRFGNQKFPLIALQTRN